MSCSLPNENKSRVFSSRWTQAVECFIRIPFKPEYASEIRQISIFVHAWIHFNSDNAFKAIAQGVVLSNGDPIIFIYRWHIYFEPRWRNNPGPNTVFFTTSWLEPDLLCPVNCEANLTRKKDF